MSVRPWHALSHDGELNRRAVPSYLQGEEEAGMDCCMPCRFISTQTAPAVDAVYSACCLNDVSRLVYYEVGSPHSLTPTELSVGFNFIITVIKPQGVHSKHELTRIRHFKAEGVGIEPRLHNLPERSEPKANVCMVCNIR
jgi:hypothetical protein